MADLLGDQRVGRGGGCMVAGGKYSCESMPAISKQPDGNKWHLSWNKSHNNAYRLRSVGYILHTKVVGAKTLLHSTEIWMNTSVSEYYRFFLQVQNCKSDIWDYFGANRLVNMSNIWWCVMCHKQECSLQGLLQFYENNIFGGQISNRQRFGALPYIFIWWW